MSGKRRKTRANPAPAQAPLASLCERWGPDLEKALFENQNQKHTGHTEFTALLGQEEKGASKNYVHFSPSGFVTRLSVVGKQYLHTELSQLRIEIDRTLPDSVRIREVPPSTWDDAVVLQSETRRVLRVGQGLVCKEVPTGDGANNVVVEAAMQARLHKLTNGVVPPVLGLLWSESSSRAGGSYWLCMPDMGVPLTRAKLRLQELETKPGLVQALRQAQSQVAASLRRINCILSDWGLQNLLWDGKSCHRIDFDNSNMVLLALVDVPDRPAASAKARGPAADDDNSARRGPAVGDVVDFLNQFTAWCQTWACFHYGEPLHTIFPTLSGAEIAAPFRGTVLGASEPVRSWSARLEADLILRNQKGPFFYSFAYLTRCGLAWPSAGSRDSCKALLQAGLLVTQETDTTKLVLADSDQALPAKLLKTISRLVGPNEPTTLRHARLCSLLTEFTTLVLTTIL